jgi:hypothetical protein
MESAWVGEYRVSSRLLYASAAVIPSWRGAPNVGFGSVLFTVAGIPRRRDVRVALWVKQWSVPRECCEVLCWSWGSGSKLWPGGCHRD